MRATTMTGEPLTPGVNVDHIDSDTGVREAAKCGYDSPTDAMVVEYAMQRWARGEEDGAMKTMMSHGIDLTSVYRILAAARVAGEALARPLREQVRPCIAARIR